jgi:O-acetyl-ADP-ribose deacetylase (regulator of RNase III)
VQPPLLGLQLDTDGSDLPVLDVLRHQLDLAERHAVHSIAFPAISCGVFGYPARRAAAIAVREIRQHLAHAQSVSTVLLVAFDSALFEVLREAAAR